MLKRVFAVRSMNSFLVWDLFTSSSSKIKNESAQSLHYKSEVALGVKDTISLYRFFCVHSRFRGKVWQVSTSQATSTAMSELQCCGNLWQHPIACPGWLLSACTSELLLLIKREEEGEQPGKYRITKMANGPGFNAVTLRSTGLWPVTSIATMEAKLMWWHWQATADLHLKDSLNRKIG